MTTISRRDYFAAHAPECPDYWNFPRPYVDDPSPKSNAHPLSHEDDVYLAAWTKWDKKCTENYNKYQLIRLAAWRKYWADLMIETMGEEK